MKNIKPSSTFIYVQINAILSIQVTDIKLQVQFESMQVESILWSESTYLLFLMLPSLGLLTIFSWVFFLILSDNMSPTVENASWVPVIPCIFGNFCMEMVYWDWELDYLTRKRS